MEIHYIFVVAVVLGLIRISLKMGGGGNQKLGFFLSSFDHKPLVLDLKYKNILMHLQEVFIPRFCWKKNSNPQIRYLMLQLFGIPTPLAFFVVCMLFSFLFWLCRIVLSSNLCLLELHCVFHEAVFVHVCLWKEW